MDELSNPKTLKILTMEKIVSCYSCINEMNNNHLFLPKVLFNELVENAPSLVKMPNYDNLDFNIWFHDTRKKLHQTLFNDHTYSKYFTVWLQTIPTDDLSIYLPVVVHFLEIYYILEINNVESIFRLCTKCFKLYLNIHVIDLNSERYRIKKAFIHKTYSSYTLQRELQEKIQSKINWCNACKQVPLFQIGNYELCEQIVGLNAHRCLRHYPHEEDNDHFIYCLNCYGSGIMTIFNFKRDINVSIFS